MKSWGEKGQSPRNLVSKRSEDILSKQREKKEKLTISFKVKKKKNNHVVIEKESSCEKEEHEINPHILY